MGGQYYQVRNEITFHIGRILLVDYIDGDYETNSYVVIDESIQLNALVTYRDKTTGNVEWSSLTPEIATVDANGLVTALNAGTAKIVAKDSKNPELKLEFVVIVLSELPEDILSLALKANESNVFTRYDLNIGNTYDKDILGSVSKLLGNSTLNKNTKYYDQANIIVVPSKTLAQGYSALTMLDLSSGDADQIVEEIKEVIANVTTGLITYSIRDTEFEDVKIKQGDYIGICNGKIVTANVSRLDSIKKLLEFSDIAEKEIITIITGKDASPEEIQAVKAHIQEAYPHVEIDEVTGDQDIYSYIFSIE